MVAGFMKVLYFLLDGTKLRENDVNRTKNHCFFSGSRDHIVKLSLEISSSLLRASEVNSGPLFKLLCVDTCWNCRGHDVRNSA